MIIDRIENRKLYQGMSPVFEEALDFMASLVEKPLGRYELETNSNIFANIMELQSLPREGRQFEFHRRYADVHFVLEGQEVLEWEDLAHLSPAVPYQEEKDIGFVEGKGQPVILEPGMFCVTLPTDAHKPSGCLEHPAYLKKVVLKIPVDG